MHKNYILVIKHKYKIPYGFKYKIKEKEIRQFSEYNKNYKILGRC